MTKIEDITQQLRETCQEYLAAKASAFLASDSPCFDYLTREIVNILDRLDAAKNGN